MDREESFSLAINCTKHRDKIKTIKTTEYVALH